MVVVLENIGRRKISTFTLKNVTFGTNYICKCTSFSNVRRIESKEKNRFTDATLSHPLRVSTSEINIYFVADPRISHQKLTVDIVQNKRRIIFIFKRQSLIVILFR